MHKIHPDSDDNISLQNIPLEDDDLDIGLSDDEIEVLDQFLQDQNCKPEYDVMPLEMMDGYLISQALNPQSKPVTEVFTDIFNCTDSSVHLPIDEAESEIKLIIKRYTEILVAIQIKLDFDLYIFPPTGSKKLITGEKNLKGTALWALGFFTGMVQWPEYCTKNPKVIEALAPIYACLGTIEEEDYPSATQELSRAKEIKNFLFADLDLNTVIRILKVSIDKAHDLLMTIKAPRTASEQPFKRENTKVGRNDPCPCGSGKKYKHCCGKRA